MVTALLGTTPTIRAVAQHGRVQCNKQHKDKASTKDRSYGGRGDSTTSPSVDTAGDTSIRSIKQTRNGQQTKWNNVTADEDVTTMKRT